MIVVVVVVAPSIIQAVVIVVVVIIMIRMLEVEDTTSITVTIMAVLITVVRIVAKYGTHTHTIKKTSTIMCILAKGMNQIDRCWTYP